MSALEARLRLTRGHFDLDVELRAPGRGVTGVFGASGSGKTTLLRCLAGLERDVRGYVRVAGEVWQDGRTGAFLPAHRRAVGYVFQEANLFPHLSVRRNLRYAMKRAPERRVGWDEAVDTLGVGPLLDRAPDGLSGGERQRAAIARALLASPRLLLLDEPLSALDDVGRREILPYLAALPDRLEIPILYVSHSLAEVGRLADRIAWLADGRVEAAGSPAAVLGRIDFARWRAEDATVVLDGTVREHDETYGLTTVDGPWGPIHVRRRQRERGERVRVQIAASDVSLSLEAEAESSILNRFELRVLELADAGPGETIVRLGTGGSAAEPDGDGEDGASDTGPAGGRGRAAAGPGPADARSDGPVLLARITRKSRDRLGLEPGMRVWAQVKSVAVLD